MTKYLRARVTYGLAGAILSGGILSAEVRLPSIVSDGMVLQRDAEMKIWGWADPGENVKVRFRGQVRSTMADTDGKWQVQFDPQEAGGPETMEISGRNRIVLEDILVGDVWLASGQSNMTHAFDRWRERYATEIAQSENPEIRQFRVPTNPVLTGPVDDIEGLEWKQANPETLLDFTVVGYFHALKLYERYNVPQGIVMSCVGGPPIESWTSAKGFSEFPKYLETIERNRDPAYVERVNAEALADREADGRRVKADKGQTGPVQWYDPVYEPLNWKSINIPGYWEDQGLRDLDGVVWYRREIEVPESMNAVDAHVKLGRIVDRDEFYVNGQKVGNTTYQYPQRRYEIPAGVLRPGKNLFVVRVTNEHGKGGFVPDKPYYMTVGDHTIDLKGEWLFRVGEAFPPQRKYKQGISAQDQPAALFNGMIAPFVNFGVRGMLWYQGESNADRPGTYRMLLENLIDDWRSHWGRGDIVFLIAQLPNFMDVDYLPAESDWALLREAQLHAARNTPNAGVGINIELGEWNDLHPGNKKPVGERLALLAMQLSYGENDLVASGPIYRSHAIERHKIILSFDHVGRGLVSSNGEELAHFAVAGGDRKFVWANARIEGDKVVVWSEDIQEPKYVRYAWADNPDFANLANKEGLPASPFRTDRKESR